MDNEKVRSEMSGEIVLHGYLIFDAELFGERSSLHLTVSMTTTRANVSEKSGWWEFYLLL